MHEILKVYFEKKKRSQPGYSLRALARDLEVSPAFVSGVMNGKRKLPFRLVERLAKILDINESDRLEIKQSYLPKDKDLAQLSSSEGGTGAAGGTGAKRAWSLADKQEFRILQQWFYLPILELTSCQGFSGETSEIAERLGISTAAAEIAVRSLLSAGALKQLPDGRLQKSTRYLRLTSATSKAEIRQFHSQMLLKANETLLKQTSDKEFARRLMMGITATANPEKIAIAKKMLSEKLYEIAEFLAEDDGSEVFHLSAQIFPLTAEKSK